MNKDERPLHSITDLLPKSMFTDMAQSIINVEQGAYKAGYEAGYRSGLKNAVQETKCEHYDSSNVTLK